MATHRREKSSIESKGYNGRPRFRPFTFLYIMLTSKDGGTPHKHHQSGTRNRLTVRHTARWRYWLNSRRLLDGFTILRDWVMRKRFKTVAVVCPITGHEREVSPRWAARVTGRSVRTAQRWANGSRIDKAANDVLAMRVFGVLPGHEWRHFRLRGGMLENVETGETWTPLQLRSFWISNQQLLEFQRQAGAPASKRLHIL